MKSFTLHMTWNGNVILSGVCSGVVAVANLTHLSENYGNAEKAGLKLPSLAQVREAEVGWAFDGEAKDETGRCSFSLRRIA